MADDIQGYLRSVMDQIGTSDKSNYTKGEVRHILNDASQKTGGCTSTTDVDKVRRGDVFIHKLVGGKVRPWIVLSVRSGLVAAVSMSSGDSAPRMIKGKCRLWPGSWIGTTVSLFEEDTARQCVSRPYTNSKHLREVEAHIAELYGLRKIKGRKSSA